MSLLDFFTQAAQKVSEPKVKIGTIIVATVLVLGGTFYAGYRSAPIQTVTKVEVVWKEKIVEVEKKTTQTTVEKTIQNDKVTTRITRINPDGSQTIEETIVDRGTSRTDTAQNTTEDTTTTTDRQQTTKETVTTVANKDWHLSLMGGYNFNKSIDKDYLLVPGQIIYG
jgi:hypothetical protein